MTEDFFQGLSNTGNPIEYADNVRRYQTQLPLGISWPTMTGSLTPRDLYSDDNSIYMYYPSGLNKTAIEIQQRDRYGGVTFTLLSGSVNLFIQASEYFADPNPAFISAPYTVSGESGTDLILASYSEDTPNNPQNYWINLPSPGTYKVVFPNPVVSTALTVTHSGSSPYIFSQMLPRKSVGGYDIDVNAIRAYHVSATLIDTIALQVADSIVVGPELIGAKSIDGSKIIDGTISGVLIKDGTVTGNKVLAGTISGVLLQGNTITGDKIVSNTITAVHIAFGTITGDKITAGTISGELITAGSITSNQIAVSGITAINLAANSITADNINVRTITADKIILNGITADEMAAAAVTSTVLANNAVVSGKVAASAIYGENIVGGTITGYHVAANTITAANIAAGTITANEISVNQLDAVAANMGTLTVNSGISIGTNGNIWAGAGSASTPTTGLKIYTTNGVSRLTTFSGGIAQVDIGSDGKLYVGSGQTLRLDSTGITLKPSVTGILNTGISTPPTISTYEILPPISNLIKYKPFYYQTDASNTTTFYDYTSDIYSFAIGANQTYLKSFVDDVTDNDTYDGIDAKVRVGWLASESGAIGYHKINNSTLSITSKGDTNSSLLVATPANKVQMDKNGVTISGYSLFGDGVTIQANTTITGDVTTSGDVAVAGNIHAGLGDHMFTVNGTTGNLHVGAPPHVFTVNGSSGNTTISGNLSVGPEPHVFKVNSSTGNVTVSGTLSVTGNTTLTGSLAADSGITVDSTAFIVANTTGNTTIAGTLGVAGQTTLGALNATGAIGFGTASNKVTIAAATGDTAIAGTLGVTGDVTTTNNVNVGGSLETTYGVLAKTQLSVGYDNVSAYRLTVGSNGDITTVGAIAAGTSNNKFTVASATGNTAIAGTLGVTGKITSAEMGYLTVRRTATLAITTAGTTIVWQSVTRSANISVSTDTITIDNAGYYMFSATFGTVANLTSLRMTLQRGVNYVSTVESEGLNTGGGYIFNFSTGFYASAGSTYKIVLTPSANTTLNFNGEGFAGPTPILNIFQSIGV